MRKCLSMVLAILLAIAVPLSAVADTQYTLSLVPGEALSLEQGIVDCFDALDLRLTTDERSGAVSVLLNDEVQANLGLAVDGTGLYASSEVLGEDVLYVTWDDAFALLNEVLKSAMLESGLSEAEIQSNMETFQAAQSSMMTALTTGEKTTSQEFDSLEEMYAQVEKVFPNDPKMLEFFKGLYDKLEIEEGEYIDINRDTADCKASASVTGDDYVTLCDTAYMHSLLKETVKVETPPQQKKNLRF